MPVLEVMRIEKRPGQAPLQAMAPDQKNQYENAIALLTRVASEASARFTIYEEKRINGVSSIISFIESREECLRTIRRAVDEEIDRIAGWTGISIDKLNGDTKQRIIERIGSFLENAFYRVQYYLASIEMPEATAEVEARRNAFTKAFVLMPTAEVNQKLAEFLDVMGVSKGEFIETVETLREILLPSGTDDILPTKERLKEMATMIAGAYIDFHLTGQPMAEGQRG